mmetsp:Transcript_107543/g.347030  ORF Transcript_107543/g.347030 Transcript_107543/m.347030 type:complete len:333 (-) Transcript_107543:27-1025(-)
MRGLAIHKCGDHVAQRRKREVDLCGLLQPVTSGARLALPLGAGQVDHVQLADTDVALAICSQCALLDGDHKDGMRPRGARVHVRLSDAPVREPGLQDLVHLLDALHHEARKVLHVDAICAVFQLAPLLWILGQEVADLLVVDLQVGAPDKVLCPLRHGVDLREDMSKGPWQKALLLDRRVGRPCHGVGLAGARLPIGENGAVEAIHDTVYNLQRSIVKDLLLRNGIVKDRVVGEILDVFVSATRSLQRHHATPQVHVHDLLPALLNLLAEEGSHTHHHLDALAALARLCRGTEVLRGRHREDLRGAHTSLRRVRHRCHVAPLPAASPLVADS